MSKHNQSATDQDDSNTVILPEPCEVCYPNDYNWAVYDPENGLSRRCSCARGRALSDVDKRRNEGRLGKNFRCIDPGRSERDKKKWARWAAEYHDEQRRWAGTGTL